MPAFSGCDSPPHGLLFRPPTAGLLVLLLLFPLHAAALDYELVWEDEFNGTEVDTSRWEFQTGDGCSIGLCGWGNNELQYYRSQNATVSGGLLTITAREESFGGKDYTSSRLRTKNRGDWTYGRFEMRAKLPIGQGIWPAFWMLSTNEEYGTWAATGEIDIMEYIGSEPDKVFGTLHYGAAFPGNVFSGNDFFLNSGTFNDTFHTFAIEWDPDEIRWYVDGAQYAAQNEWWSTGGPFAAPFDVDFHLLLNLAVGGNLPGPPDGSTVFPQEFVIDYVRVYQRDEYPDCRVVFDNMSFTNPFAKNYFIFNGAGNGTVSSNLVNYTPEGGCCRSLNASWSSGGSTGFLGGFGRTFPIDLTDMTHFEFWIEPDAGQNFTLEVNLQDDDNGDNSIPGSPDGADDEFQY
ncbi:MAG: glycoside hydrolase family 16 protein, partial [Gemmatimonadetes bacterium]|nr:glycoside hydrolase family 16 protein [Gemmatimonadota bacterium]